jgi:hypothetical protein
VEPRAVRKGGLAAGPEQPEDPPMPRAYAITAEAIAKERSRVQDDLEAIDPANVIQLEQLELPPLGAGDVHLKILAVSGEHNVDHAAIADTANIVEVRGGKIYPGNSAVAEVLAVGEGVTKFKAGDIVVTHANGEPDEFGFPLRIWAYDQPDSIGWYSLPPLASGRGDLSGQGLAQAAREAQRVELRWRCR